MLSENDIPPPSLPLTVKINQAVLDFVYQKWVKKNLPAYEVVITSSYRSPEHNEKVGGAKNSAHVHGLAYDIILKQGGVKMPIPMAKSIYEKFVKDTWPGYSEFEIESGVWHIHLNLTREITTYAGLTGGVALGALAWKIIKDWGE